MSANTMEELKVILPLIVVWGTAFIALLLTVMRSSMTRTIIPLISVVGLAASGVYAFKQITPDGSVLAFGESVIVDPLACLSIVALAVSGVLSVLASWTYLGNRDLDHGEYYVLLLFAVSGAMLMAVANDMVSLFLGLEVLSFALYVLVGFARTEAKSEEASIKYFLLGAFASAFFLFGIALVYGASRATNLADIALAISNPGHGGAMMLGGVALILVGLGFKAGVVPFHQWTPDVYEGAPTSVTGFMAAVAKIGAFAAIIRVFSTFVPLSGQWMIAVQVLAVLTMIVGNLLAMNQVNIKRMLAYSSIAHAGYLLVAIAAMGHLKGQFAPAADIAMRSAVFYLFAYSIMTVGAFAVLIYLSSRGRDCQTLYDLRGLARTDAPAAYTMLFFVLSLGGIPPTMGFIGKAQIFYAAVSGHQYGLAIVMALTSLMGIFYYLRIVYFMCLQEPDKDAPIVTINARGGAAITMYASALIIIVLGIFPDLLGSVTRLIQR